MSYQCTVCDVRSLVARLVVLAGAITSSGWAQQPARLKTDRDVQAAVEALLKQMTLDEKIGQLNQVSAASFLNPPNREELIRKGAVGSMLWSIDPAQLDKFQHIAVDQSRLHIPLLFGYDVIHGFRTVFPAPLAMASSWDPEIEERAQTFAAREARATGITWTFGPMVDIARDARWGRIVEGAGEDPYLGAAMARAQVRGFQGPALGTPDRLLACVKHYVGYGAAEGGRDYDAAYLPEASLRNVYLVPFKAAVDAGVGSLMSAYLDLNDVPASGNRYTLHDILRGEWHFKGFVVSDALAVKDLVTHGYARDTADAAYLAFHAGVNEDMASLTLQEQLPKLVRAGRISPAEIDEAVRPVLAVKFRLGLFEHPYADLSRLQQVMSDPAARQFARVAAQRSVVLLRNDGHTLPLSKSVTSIAVIGPLATAATDLDGGWGVDGETPAVTVEEGIRAKLPGASVRYARGGEIRRTIPSVFGEFLPVGKKQPSLTDAENAREVEEAVALARQSDVAVLVLGELADISGEYASRSTLELPGRQQELLEKVAALGKPVVLVLVGGRPLNITWAAERVPAILEAWQPGTEAGNAIADVMFGDVNPGGKLPVSWPRRAGQEPLYYSHNLTHMPEGSWLYRSLYWEEPNAPLYPFGYGLSYTTFAYSDLQLSKAVVKLGEAVEVTAIVGNTGAVAGDEVVQLYTHQQAGSASRPVRELKGFRRISLNPGAKQLVRFTLTKDELSYWSTSKRAWVEEPEGFDVWVGSDSKAALHASFRVTP